MTEPVRTEALYAVFGIGIGNLGRSNTPRRSMSRWVQMLNANLLGGHPSLRILGSFGHTGNFLTDSPSRNLAEVAARFHRLLDADWVVRPIDDVRAALMAVADAHDPPMRKAFAGHPASPFMPEQALLAARSSQHRGLSCGGSHPGRSEPGSATASPPMIG